jgi:hypothetical protein
MQLATVTGDIMRPALLSQQQLQALSYAAGVLGKRVKEVIKDVIKYVYRAAC